MAFKKLQRLPAEGKYTSLQVMAFKKPSAIICRKEVYFTSVNCVCVKKCLNIRNDRMKTQTDTQLSKIATEFFLNQVENSK
jgi:hypothetical protein